MKINSPTASQQYTRPPEEQVVSARVVTQEGPALGAALQGLADASASRRRLRADGAEHRRSASHSGKLGDALAPEKALTGQRVRDPVNEPAPKRQIGGAVRENRTTHPGVTHAPRGSLVRAFSAGDLCGDSTAPTLPFTDLVGKDRAEQLDREWGTLQGARVKNGKAQIHAWEEGLHPDRVVVPVDNPHGCDLKNLIDLESLKAGTPMLWSVGMGAPLILGPHTLLPDPDPKTGKERRLGHPALVAGDKDPGSGAWAWGKQARVSGELRWDESRQRLYIINQSGRHSRHPDRGMDQMIHVAQQFEKSGLPVEIRLVERES